MKKTIYLFAPLFIIILLITSIISPCISMSENISSKVFRLHIRANSDGYEDQELKLLVRDELLKETRSLFSCCKSVDDAINAVNSNIQRISKTVNKTIEDNGFDYQSSLRVGKEFFETRRYEGFTLPSGVYDSLIIELGDGRGHNWWCVMFPSVCVSGCTDDFDGVLTEEERKLIEEDKYIVKFKVVEIYERIKRGVRF